MFIYKVILAFAGKLISGHSLYVCGNLFSSCAGMFWVQSDLWPKNISILLVSVCFVSSVDFSFLVFTCNILFWKMLSNSMVRTYTGFDLFLQLPIYVMLIVTNIIKEKTTFWTHFDFDYHFVWETAWLYFRKWKRFCAVVIFQQIEIFCSSVSYLQVYYVQKCIAKLFVRFLEQVIACSRFTKTTERIEQIASTTAGAQQRREWRW